MSDPAAIIRSAFPRWRADPYQRTAVDALLRILFAGEAVTHQLSTVETCLVAFLDDPPLSLAFRSPARQAETLARQLDALAHELRKGSKQLRELEPYVDQFVSNTAGEASQHGGLRPNPGTENRGSAAGPTPPS